MQHHDSAAASSPLSRMTSAAAGARVGADQLLWAAVLAGLVYRAWGFWVPSLWVDELVTQWVVSADSLWGVMQRAHYAYLPPLYFLTVLPFTEVLGVTPFAIRLPSVLLGTVALVTLYRLCRTTCGPRIAAVAVLLAAAHPEHLWYSQEGRVYALAMALAPLVIEAAWLAVHREDRRRALIRYAVLSGVLAWVHHLLAPLVLILGAWLIYGMVRTGRPTLREWVSAHAGIAAIAALPALGALLIVATGTIPDVPRPDASLRSLAKGWRLPELTIFLLVGSLIAAAAQRVRPGAPRVAAQPTDEDSAPAAMALFALLLVGVPMIHTLLGVTLDRPFYLLRYRMPVAVLICPLFAFVALRLIPVRRRELVAAALVVLLHVLFPIRMLATQGLATYHHTDIGWDRVLSEVVEEHRPGTAILLQNPLAEYRKVDVERDPKLDSLLLAPLHSDYVPTRTQREITASYALPPSQPTERFVDVAADRLRRSGQSRALLVVAEDIDELVSPASAGERVRIEGIDGWTFRPHEVWKMTIYVGTATDA